MRLALLTLAVSHGLCQVAVSAEMFIFLVFGSITGMLQGLGMLEWLGTAPNSQELPWAHRAYFDFQSR